MERKGRAQHQLHSWVSKQIYDFSHLFCRAPLAANVVPMPSGDLLIVGAQVLQASQFIVEEKYLGHVSTIVPPLGSVMKSRALCHALLMQ